MNRKQRRAARSQSQNPGATAGQPPAAGDVVRLFAAALRQHRSGQIAEAAVLYHRILELQPKHLDSLQNLAAIAGAAGRHEMAVDLLRQAITIDDKIAVYHQNISAALVAMGRPDDALAHGRRAAELAPADGRAALWLGRLLADRHRPAEALAQFERAVALDPALAEAHYRLGLLHNEQGRLPRAIECFLRAIELKPDFFDAHYSFCAALLVQSRFREAAAHCEQILAHKPDFVGAWHHLAVARIGSGEPERALDAIRRALAISETADNKSLFGLCLQEMASVPHDDGMRDLLVRAMSEPWGRPGDVAGHGVAMVKGDPVIARFLKLAAGAWPRLPAPGQFIGADGFDVVASDKVLRCLLENTRIADVAMERFLTAVRAALLDAAHAAGPDDEIDAELMAFACALARQCFINEYVYAESGQEHAALGDLHGKIAGVIDKVGDIPALWLAACAAYQPLHTLANGENLLARQWPEPVDALLTQQIREPAEEARLRDQIPRLTPVSDNVSRMVQRQYEENPYPRWVKAAPASRAIDINLRLRNQFCFAEFGNLERPDGILDVLVAGCGTGQQLVDVAQRIAGARVLAIDLSLASMAYARRKTDALGIRNIEYGQADILQLATLGRRFDIVDCGGVLHHLGDPMAGWRVLLSLLRPDGFMRIALYSEAARAGYAAVQKFVTERGYGRTAAEIRRFRQDLFAHSDPALRRAAITSPDFFSTSDCRDLLFHVQEHRMRLPQIKAFLADNGLRFLGFEIGHAVKNRYAAQFPADRAMSDLDNWHAFEQQRPKTFLGMYQFWVQRRETGARASASAA